MRTISLHTVIAADETATALTMISDFERFPHLCDDVHFVETHPETRLGARDSDWAVNFRHGLMRWNEQEVIDAPLLRIDFEQTDGDFAEFYGSWELSPAPAGTNVIFTVTYDFGIESLVGIMDPIAERIIKRTICVVLAKIFGDVSVLKGGEALSDLGETPQLPGLITTIGESHGRAQQIRIQNDLRAAKA